VKNVNEKNDRKRRGVNSDYNDDGIKDNRLTLNLSTFVFNYRPQLIYLGRFVVERDYR